MREAHYRDFRRIDQGILCKNVECPDQVVYAGYRAYSRRLRSDILQSTTRPAVDNEDRVTGLVQDTRPLAHRPVVGTNAFRPVQQHDRRMLTALLRNA